MGTVFVAHPIFRRYFYLTVDIRSNMTASLDQDKASFKPDSEQYLANNTIPWLSVAKKNAPVHPKFKWVRFDN